MRRTLKELTLKDTFMFGAVMVDPENCRKFLECTLGIKIAQIAVSKERSMIYHPEYKGVRLDVYAKDEHNTRYNVEMQVTKKPALGKRSRYYQSQMDMELLQSGSDYAELPKTFVIFICDFDLFEQGKYRYTFRNCCKETDYAEIQDERQIIILNTKGNNEAEVPKELVSFLKFVGADLADSEKEYGDSYVEELQRAVRKVKVSREMEERFMTLEELLQDEREEGRREGNLQGTRDILEHFLQKFGTIPESLMEIIHSEPDLNRLEVWIELAVKSTSMEEFIKEISHKS